MPSTTTATTARTCPKNEQAPQLPRAEREAEGPPQSSAARSLRHDNALRTAQQAAHEVPSDARSVRRERPRSALEFLEGAAAWLRFLARRTERSDGLRG